MFSGYMKGVNLGGWFSQCEYTQEHYDSFITEADFVELSSWGLDHVRVPVDYNLVETEDGEYIESGFERIKGCIACCRKYGLNMILDLHKTYGYSFDEGENQSGFFDNTDYQERFYRLWEQFSTRFGSFSDMLSFELLNEVTDPACSDTWNRIAEECICRIRKICPDINILVGGYWNNSVDAVKDLLPPHDRHVIYNFHCYEPLVFTHQGAYWVKGMPKDFRCSFDCTEGEMADLYRKLLPDVVHGFPAEQHLQKLGAAYFIRLFEEAVRKAENEGTSLYCGEYGVIEHAAREDAEAWYRAIHEAFSKYGIGHAAWSYKKMDFDLLGKKMKYLFAEEKE